MQVCVKKEEERCVKMRKEEKEKEKIKREIT